MSILRNLFPKRSHSDPIGEAAKLLESFAALAMASADPHAIERHPRKHKTILAFHFGAIRELAARHDLDETAQLALGVRFVTRWFGAQAAETGSVTAIAEELAGAEWQPAIADGAAAMRAWLDRNDKTAPRQLADLLRDNRFVVTH
jgi:hypothetical protein